MPGGPGQGARRGPRRAAERRAGRWRRTFLPQRGWSGQGALSPSSPPEDGIQAGEWKPGVCFLSCWPTGSPEKAVWVLWPRGLGSPRVTLGGGSRVESLHAGSCVLSA